MLNVGAHVVHDMLNVGTHVVHDMLNVGTHVVHDRGCHFPVQLSALHMCT
jgi:hypothetical protein